MVVLPHEARKAPRSSAVQGSNTKHPVTRPEPGKPLVYFMQDDQDYEHVPRPTVRWGLDGTWGGRDVCEQLFLFFG
jgi:hypothetical protein